MRAVITELRITVWSVPADPESSSARSAVQSAIADAFGGFGRQI